MVTKSSKTKKKQTSGIILIIQLFNNTIITIAGLLVIQSVDISEIKG